MNGGRDSSGGLDVTFYGVRGSTPTACPSVARYGGNTSCAVIDGEGIDPIVLDLGTGLRFYGQAFGDAPFRGSALVTHLHWDHVQGLPFFAPLLQPGAEIDIYGPRPGGPDGQSLEEAIRTFVHPPFFPVTCDELPGEFRFHDCADSEVDISTDAADACPVRVVARSVPHVGTTNGYRIEVGDATIAYIPDHQEPVDRPNHVDPAVLELAVGADLLIHDAQFTPELLTKRQDWGHCTVRYALEVANQAGVDTLVLFHHDPLHDDDTVDRLHAQCCEWAEGLDNVEQVIAAAEGLKIPVSRRV